MALLRSSRGTETTPIIRGRGVMLRAPAMMDYPAWAELRAMSRDHLSPWEPLWARDELTRSAFRRRIRHYQRESREDLGYAFLIFAAPQAADVAQASGNMSAAANAHSRAPLLLRAVEGDRRLLL